MTKIIIIAVMIAIFCIAYGMVLYVSKGTGDETFYTIDYLDMSSKAMNDMRQIIDDERAKAEETIKELEGLNEFYKNKVEFYKGQVEAYQYCMNCRR